MDNAAVTALREGVRGRLITSADDEYDVARQVRNGMVDKRPALIVQPANAGDVMTAVRFAADHGLTVAVRGGGHSVPGFGTCDGGVVIDLSAMRGVRVDPLTRTARVAGGATWGDLNAAAYPFGLATTGGIISTTGVGGLTVGGGIGYLARSLGLALDNLVSADVVTGDGTFHVTSEKEEPDLFWAIRGGGGNFGVVTSFEFRLSPVKDIYGGPMFFELDRAGDLFRRLPRVHRGRPRGVRRLPGLPDRAPAGVHPGGPARQAIGAPGGVLGRRPGPGREDAQALPRPRTGGRGGGRSDALPRPQQRVRRSVPVGAASLLEGELRQGAHRRCDRCPRRARLPGARTRVDDAHLPHQRRLSRRDARLDRVRLPRRELRDGHRRDVARREGRREEHRLGQGLLRRHGSALGGGWLHQLHGRRRPGAHPGQLPGQLRPARCAQGALRPAPTCSGTTRTSRRPNDTSGTWTPIWSPVPGKTTPRPGCTRGTSDVRETRPPKTSPCRASWGDSSRPLRPDRASTTQPEKPELSSLTPPPSTTWKPRSRACRTSAPITGASGPSLRRSPSSMSNDGAVAQGAQPLHDLLLVVVGPDQSVVAEVGG